MNRNVLWLVLVVALIGCCAWTWSKPAARLPDTKLQIFYEPDQVASLRAQLAGEWFEIPRDHMEEVLKALQPTSYISSRTKCEVFANIDLESDAGQTYQVYVHTSSGGFDVHTRFDLPAGSSQPFIEFSSRDWRNLQQVLQNIENKVRRDPP